MTNPSRRHFLARSGSALGATWVAMSLPALLTACEESRDQASDTTAFEILTMEEATELGAIVAQIIPTTDTPGAREAGVIHFLDAAFGTFYASMLDPIRGGLSDVQVKVAKLHESQGSQGSQASQQSDVTFSSLSDEGQIAVMKQIESEPYFGLMQFGTAVGMFSHPKYGGNKDKVGWEIIGFDDRHTWQPPFGHYDEEYQNAGE